MEDRKNNVTEVDFKRKPTRKERRAHDRKMKKLMSKASKEGNIEGGNALLDNVQSNIGLSSDEMDTIKANLSNPEVVNNLSYGEPQVSIEMTKDNVMVFEKIDENQGGKVTEVFSNPDNPDDAKLYSIKGYKILSIHDNNSKELTHYDNTTDNTDLSCLADKENHYLCCVDKNEYDEHVWNCFLVNKYFSEELVSIADGRACTPEECTLLDTVYPEYFNNAF